MEEVSSLQSHEIDFADFLKVEIRVGKIIEVTENLKAKKSAYILKIDFGSLGYRVSSAQITENYSREDLLGKQITAVMNFPPKRVAGVKSEILILAAVCENSGTVLLSPTMIVENGTRIA
jgi:tRNA-binding protein